jgi:small subunit ribosomal protein S8
MSMNDPIADMLTRIRNGQTSGKTQVSMQSSNKKVAIANVLEAEGYIAGSSVEEVEGKPTLHINLKYFKGRPVIEGIQRYSKSGRREYRGKGDIPVVIGGLGVSIVSTSQGVMSGKKAEEQGQGGEVLCTVW